MVQKKRLGLTGPFLLSLGGAFALFPILSFEKLLIEGRLSWPNDNAFIGMSAWTLIFVFLGLFLSGLGVEIILDNAKDS